MDPLRCISPSRAVSTLKILRSLLPETVISTSENIVHCSQARSLNSRYATCFTSQLQHCLCFSSIWFGIVPLRLAIYKFSPFKPIQMCMAMDTIFIGGQRHRLGMGFIISQSIQALRTCKLYLSAYRTSLTVYHKMGHRRRSYNERRAQFVGLRS